MRLVVIEWVCSGRLPEQEVPPSLMKEGTAMLGALLRDLASIEGVDTRSVVAGWCHLELPANVRITSAAPDWQRTVDSALADSDTAWLIAPEFDDELAALVTLAESCGAALVSPGLEFVRLTADKSATCQRLAAAGVPVASGQLWAAGSDIPAALSWPVVVKRNDGAGSLDMRVANGKSQLPDNGTWRLEELVSGTPASIAFACGPAGQVLLGTATQKLTDDGTLSYTGGETPLAPKLAIRAERLGRQALQALPPTTGYVGIDIVLGDDESGAGDVVVEVNPRLTTSYIGHRAATSINLAEVVLQSARGIVCPPPRSERSVSFDAAGNVTILD